MQTHPQSPAIHIGRQGLNANTLKLIAVLAMFSQHIAIGFVADPLAHEVLYDIGRITAPIMCFFIAEGYYHTSNLRRYLLRLFLGAILGHIPHALYFGFSISRFWSATSVMWTLFLGLWALTIYRSQWKPLWKLAGILLCCALSYPGNFNVIGVLWVLAFGVFYYRPILKWVAYSGVIALWVVEFYIVDSVGTAWSRLLALAAIPLLLMYNHTLGRKSKLLQWSYYLVYPIHFLVLYAIRLWL